MFCRPSYLIRLTTSVTWVSRSTAGVRRWTRSPRPVSVGVKTLWPCFSSRSATRRQHQPPCQEPCTSTKVRGSACACAEPIVAAAAALSDAPAASKVRRDVLVFSAIGDPPGLVHGDVGGANDRSQPFDVVSHQSRHVLWRAAERLHAARLAELAAARGFEEIIHDGVDPAGDGRRCPDRCEHAIPNTARDIEAEGFAYGRHVGQYLDARCRSHGDRLHVENLRNEAAKSQSDLTAHHVGEH